MSSLSLVQTDGDYWLELALVQIVSLLAVGLYAVANFVQAWSVVRRKPIMAVVFMISAVIIGVSSVAFIYSPGIARPLLVFGLIFASLGGLLNAWIVLGKVILWRHLVRASIALVIYVLITFGWCIN